MYDYAKWNDELGRHEMIVPASDIGGLKGITGWVKERFGIHVLYKPVVLVYDCRDTDSELKLTNEIVALIRSLPIREIRLCKSRFIGAEMFNMLTHDEYLRVVRLFPGHVVVKTPDEVSTF